MASNASAPVSMPQAPSPNGMNPMGNSSAIPPSAPLVPPPPPPGTNYLAAIAPSVHDLMVTHTFLMIIFTLFIAMLYFSSPPARRKPIFILTVATVILAIASGTLLDYRSIHTILSPLQAVPISFDLATGILGAVQSLLVDTVLLLRLLSVYPRSFVGRTRFTAILAFPLLLKVLRVTNLIVFIVILARASKGPNASVELGLVWASKPNLKIEWVAQVADNAYASTLFLWKLWSRKKSSTDSGAVTNSRISFGERLRILFWIAVTNFVFPVLFSIAQLIVVLRPNVNVADVNDIVLVNTSIAVIGVVFAITWAGSVSWQRNYDSTVHSDGTGDIEKAQKDFKVSAPVFAIPVRSTISTGTVSFSTGNNSGKTHADAIGLTSVSDSLNSLERDVMSRGF